MFVEKHRANNTTGPLLAFMKSLDVQAFPCGRRRSELVDNIDANNDGQVKDDEKFYIPYDPEARLNTEANALKHTGINGYNNSFIKEWDTTYLTLVIGGYFFKIATQYANPSEVQSTDDASKAFGSLLATYLDNSSANSIYANIRIEEVPLYSGFTTYYTGVLRDQTATTLPSVSIDLLIPGTQEDIEKQQGFKVHPENYFYFAGLSFSTEPLAGELDEDAHYKEALTYRNNDGGLHQRTISLRILERPSAGADWIVYQQALLPNVKHGDTENSVSVNTLYANNLVREAGGVRTTVPSLKLVQNASDQDLYKMVFSDVTVINNTPVVT